MQRQRLLEPQTPWVVYCKPTVQGSAAVLRYLARYVHRAAITDARIIAVTDSQVTFSYKDAHAHQWRRMTLGGEEFLRRFLQHVLPRGFTKVRWFGLLSASRRADLERARHLAAQRSPVAADAPPSCPAAA